MGGSRTAMLSRPCGERERAEARTMHKNDAEFGGDPELRGSRLRQEMSHHSDVLRCTGISAGGSTLRSPSASQSPSPPTLCLSW